MVMAAWSEHVGRAKGREGGLGFRPTACEVSTDHPTILAEELCSETQVRLS